MNFEFTSIKNFRDLGGLRLTGGGLTRHGVFARSDLPKTLKPEELDALREGGFTTVIDLRIPDEMLCFPHALEHAEGFDYHPLKLDNWLRDRFYTPSESAAYYHMLLAYKDNLLPILTLCADAGTGVFFNCYAGKDRTGVLAALLLLLAGVCDEDIIADYRATYDSFWGGVPEEKMKFRRLVPVAENMVIFLDIFRRKYGDAESYCRSIGLDNEKINKIRRKLTE